MALIPAGYFQMGAADGPSDEQPEHPVLLDAYYIDLYEVTNSEYAGCVASGRCTPTSVSSSATRQAYYSDPAFAHYPVIGVTWDQASNYCLWLGKRLPTEAEWEFAASGVGNFTWPWGNTFDPARLTLNAADTEPKDSYPSGASEFGVYHLAGNVAEWVADGYVPDYYTVSPARNPLTAGDGLERVYRGGAFGHSSPTAYAASRRYHRLHDSHAVDIGFRCSQSASEVWSRTPETQRLALEAEFCALYAVYQPQAICP
jgi:formylglycine-generating enzyme required for sulfatase activity